jgi:hypothetical protein
MIILNTNNINLAKFGFVLLTFCVLTNEIVKSTSYTKLEIMPLVVGVYFIINQFVRFRKK